MISYEFLPDRHNSSRKKKAVFLDRDGVINVDFGYVYKSIDFVFLPGVIEGLKTFQNNGFELIVITNQSGMARGYYSQEDYNNLTKYYQDILIIQGVRISGIYCCPHHPRGSVEPLAISCDCRKPSPGMLLKAASDLDLDLGRSFMIGDKITDMLAAKSAGLRYGVLLSNELAEPIDFPIVLSHSLYEYSKVLFPLFCT